MFEPGETAASAAGLAGRVEPCDLGIEPLIEVPERISCRAGEQA
jgi:hypothetical protein